MFLLLALKVTKQLKTITHLKMPLNIVFVIKGYPVLDMRQHLFMLAVFIPADNINVTKSL